MKKVDDELNLPPFHSSVKQLFFNQNLTNKLIQVVEQNQNFNKNSSKLRVLYIYGPVRLYDEGCLYIMSVYNDNQTFVKKLKINYDEISNLIRKHSSSTPSSLSSSESNISLNGNNNNNKCKVYWRHAKAIEIEKNVDYQPFTYFNYAEMPKILQNYFQFEIKHSILNQVFQKKKLFFNDKLEKTLRFMNLSADLLKLTQIQSLKSFLFQDIIINLYLEMNKIMFTSKILLDSTEQSNRFLVKQTQMNITKLIIYKSNEELQQISEMSLYSGQNDFKQDNLLIMPLKSNDLGNNYYFYRENTIYIIQITVIHKLNLNHKLKLLAKLFHRSSGTLTQLWKSIYGNQLKFELVFISYDNRRPVYEKIEKGLFTNTVFQHSNQFMAFEDFKHHLNNFIEAKLFFEKIDNL
jgi:hypothetical protein